ncbi:MAG: hypothetical protein RJQ14_04400, partial [Marinoscillum sp.]
AQMLQAVLAEEIDVMFAALDFNYYLYRNSISGVKLVYIPEHPGFELVYSIRKDYEPLISILNKSIEAIGKTERLKIANKWLQVSEAPKREFLEPEEQRFLEQHRKIKVVVTKLIRSLNTDTFACQLCRIRQSLLCQSPIKAYLKLIVGIRKQKILRTLRLGRGIK